MSVTPEIIPDGNWDEALTLARTYFDDVIKNGEHLDEKGWNILSFSSSTFAIVAVLQALLADKDGVSGAFWIGLAIVIAIYGVLALLVLLATRPMDYQYPLGLPSKDRPLGEWNAMYLTSHERALQQQLLSNLIGTGDTPGAIQDNELTNELKSRYVAAAMVMMVLLFVGLVILSIVATAA